MDCSTPGFPVHHQLLELAQTHVHGAGDAIQPSHPLSSPSPPTFKLSQHQGLFHWVSSSHQVARGLGLQHQFFQGILLGFSQFTMLWWFQVNSKATQPFPLKHPSHPVEVAQSCPTLCDPIDCSPPGSSVHGTLQARILEWVAMPSCRGFSRSRDGTPVSCIAGRFFTLGATRLPNNLENEPFWKKRGLLLLLLSCFSCVRLCAIP